MEYIISKELLSEVLGQEVSDVEVIGNKVNYICPNYETEEDGESVYINLGTNINIYELAHKCKVYVYKNYGYKIIDEPYISLIYNCGSRLKFKICDYQENMFSEKRTIKACQWILDNEVKNDNN
jgi:hypothetical protein